MTWTWRFEDADGSTLGEPTCPAQASQADAESWLGEAWRSLRDAGVTRVVLLDAGRDVYRMPLSDE